MSGSCSSRRPRARYSVTTEVPDHTFRHRRESEPNVAAKAGKRLPKKSLGAIRGTCKDAAAQTDLSPKAMDKPQCHPPQRSDEPQKSVDYTQDNPRCSALLSSRDNMDKASQAPIFAGEQSLPVLKVSRNAPHVCPEVERHRFDGVDILGRGITTCPRDAGSFLYPPIQPAKQLDHVEPTRPNNTYESQPRTNHAGDIPERFGVENLEEFIRRIEDEAAMPLEETGDGPAFRYDEFEMPGHPTPRPPMLSRAANFDGAGDTTTMSSRDWFAVGPDLLTPDLVGDPASFSQPDFGRPTSLSLLDSYTKHEEYPRTAWQHRNMF
ncbi:hypothetical protein B0I37DRAFT_30285 [Chaetomium sp. MPI-CAGE-AT-0009]|nr:hypothetical protein B0I37DRAFT_30285 [Chaetomium sp. MPI-CAGE-AT-0009]